MPHLENEAVDGAGGLQFAHPLPAQQAAQHAVVAAQQFGKEHFAPRFLDDESTELGDDEPFVTAQIMFYRSYEHVFRLWNQVQNYPFSQKKQIPHTI